MNRFVAFIFVAAALGLAWAKIPADTSVAPEPPVIVNEPVDPEPLRVLVWWESEPGESPLWIEEQLTGPELRGWMQENKIAFRFWDDETDSSGDGDAMFREAGKTKPSQLPCLVVFRSVPLFVGQLPATPKETIALIGKFQ